jgi:glycosyltransferase involved in cell wall biosynthesis
VTLSLGSQTFQKPLATKLAQDGMLARVLSFGRDLEIFEPDSERQLRLIRRYTHYRIANRVMWAAWKRLPLTDRSRYLPQVPATAYSGWLLSRGMPRSDIFHGWSCLCHAGLQVARRQNAVTLVEHPSMHPRIWQDAVLQECETWGVRPRECQSVFPKGLFRRMVEEIALADFAIVPSAVAVRSFEDAGLAGKALVVHAGTDHCLFKPAEADRDEKMFRVCYAGRVELAKGVVYLLKAWKKLSLPNAELVLIGKVAPEMSALIRENAISTVRFEGYLRLDRLAEVFRSSDVFAFPSVTEGLARVLMEGMASGLPVVATDCSGAADCVTEGVDGTVIPPRDVDAMAEALLWHYRNRDATKAMGRAARATIEARFTVAHYVERMMDTYRLVAESRAV